MAQPSGRLPGGRHGGHPPDVAPIDGWLDCADFDILRLLTLWYGYHDDLPTPVLEAIERRLLEFRYWFTDPGPEGVVDERW